MKNSIRLIKIFLISALLLLPVYSWAQGPGFDDDTTDAPIDGGISMLVVAGVGYGVKKIAEKRKKNKVVSNTEDEQEKLK